tara:strand:- start:3005 stop:3790 length:786 start_codon:yes stop_codon:yes gene_type:complete
VIKRKHSGLGEQLINPPIENKRRALLRMTLEAMAQSFPLTAGLARFYQFTHPSDHERVVAQWRDAISREVNDHGAAIDQLIDQMMPGFKLSGPAYEVASWIARTSVKGLSFEQFMSELPDELTHIDTEIIDEAISELEDLSLVVRAKVLGRHFAYVRPTYDLFKFIDPLEMGWDPAADAIDLGGRLLEDKALFNVRRLHAATEWSSRRFNPALSVIVEIVGLERCSKEIQADYVTTQIMSGPGERSRIKRFLEKCGASGSE